jgi:hypothetical protein
VENQWVWLCCGGCERRHGRCCALTTSPPPISSPAPPGMAFEVKKKRRHLWDQPCDTAIISLIYFNNAIKQLAPT